MSKTGMASDLEPLAAATSTLQAQSRAELDPVVDRHPVMVYEGGFRPGVWAGWEEGRAWLRVAINLLRGSEALRMEEAAAVETGGYDMEPEPARSMPIKGSLVTHSFPYDGGRQVTAYVPASSPEAVVFAGDGQLISQWGGYLEAADLPPTLIVGAHRTDDDDEMVRIQEYSPSFNDGRFAAHEAFLVDDVRGWVRSRFDVALPASRSAICGVSASGELSLALGLRHPDVYGAVFSASPGGGYRPPDVLPGVLPRVYLVAGTLEPFFLDNATRWANALRNAGGEVVMTERAGGHGDPFWQAEFVRMVAWLFRS